MVSSIKFWWILYCNLWWNHKKLGSQWSISETCKYAEKLVYVLSEYLKRCVLLSLINMVGQTSHIPKAYVTPCLKPMILISYSTILYTPVAWLIHTELLSSSPWLKHRGLPFSYTSKWISGVHFHDRDLEVDWLCMYALCWQPFTTHDLLFSYMYWWSF